MGDITDEEKKQLIHELILQTPPGEFNATFNDVRMLVDNDTIMKQCGKTYMEYWLEQLTPVEVGDAGFVSISREGRQPDGSFLAPDSKKLFTFDPMRKEANVVGDYSGPSEHEEFRSAIADKIRAYVKNHYAEGVETVLAKTNPETNMPEISIIIESHSYMLHNFHTASWRESWNVKIDQSGGSAHLKGTVKVQVHYYEEGNVQKVSKKDMESTIKFTDIESLAKDISECLERMTNEYQRSIVEMYEKFQSHTFKSLRRALPITHSKMNWEQIATYKIGQELQKNH